MRVSIQANTPNLAGLGLDPKKTAFGITYGTGQGENIQGPFVDFLKTIIAKLIIPKESKEARVFSGSIAKSSAFFEQFAKHIPGRHDNLMIQLNVPTGLNSLLQIIGAYSHLVPEGYEYHFAQNSSTGAAHTYINSSVIVMGSGLFQQSVVGSCLKKNLGIERASSLVFFHEAAHNLDFWADPNNWSNKIQHEGTAHSAYFYEQQSTKRETYADVSAVLLQRNFDLQKGHYNHNQTQLDIKSFQEARNLEMTHFNSSSIKSSLNSLAHFTVAGLQELQREIPKYGNKPLTHQEIEHIARNITEIGLAKTMVVTASAENFNSIFKQFDSIDSIIGTFGLGEKINVKWLENHKKTVDFLKEHQANIPIPTEQLIWYYEFQPELFKKISQDIENSTGLKMPEVYTEDCLNSRKQESTVGKPDLKQIEIYIGKEQETKQTQCAKNYRNNTLNNTVNNIINNINKIRIKASPAILASTQTQKI